MYCGMKSSMNSIGGQYHQSRNKLSSPWINGETKSYQHHHHHHHLSFNDKLNTSESSSVHAATNRSSFSSESNDELENCSSELFLSASPSPSTSASSTPKTKTNKKLKFGVDAILELPIDKKSQERVHFNDTSPKRTSDSEYSPPSKKSFTNSPSTEISKNSDFLIKSLSKEELDNERTSSCDSSPEPDGNTPRKNQSNPSLPHLFRPTFLYQMPYQQSQIPSFIPLLFATVDARQKGGQPTDLRLQQYLTQQHAYHMMVRTRAFQENSINNVPTNHQLYTSPLRSVLSNSSQLPFTAGGYAIGNYSGTINNNGCHSNNNNSNNLPSTTSNLKKKRSWSRAVFSNLQRKGLEKRFEIQKYVTKPDRRQLAAMLGLTDAQVKVWFQNRRMKWRHLEETTTHKKRESGRHDDQDNHDENGNDVSAGEVKSETCEFPDDDDEHH